MANWRDVLTYLPPVGTAAVYTLVGGILAVVIAHRQQMWRRTLPFLLLFVISQLGLVAAGLIGRFLENPPLGGDLRELFVLFEGIAVIGLAGRTLFGVLLTRFRPARILEDVILVVGYGIWGMIRLRHSGVDIMSVVATSAVITGVIAFAMQDTLGNILGGLALQIDSSVRIGQWIRVDDVVGQVRQIRWRSTTIETLDWETVVLPNSLLVKSKFRVLGRDEGHGSLWRRSVEFDADSDFPPQLVISTAEESLRAAEIAGIVTTPLPVCEVLGVTLGLGHYSLHYWIADAGALETSRSSAVTHLATAMDRAGIRLFAPTLVNVVITGTARHDDVVAANVHSNRLHALTRMELFASLDEAELESLAAHLTRAPFASGDVLVKQGTAPHWLYLLTRGEVDLYVEAPDQSRQWVTTLVAPSLLGEPGMVSGAKRGVTAIARTDVECYRLDKEGFAGVLRAKPEITRILAERIASLAAMRASLRHASTDSHQATDSAAGGTDLLAKVSRFFGLGGHPN